MKESQKKKIELDPEELFENVSNGLKSFWKKTVETVDKLEEKCNNLVNRNKPK